MGTQPLTYALKRKIVFAYLTANLLACGAPSSTSAFKQEQAYTMTAAQKTLCAKGWAHRQGLPASLSRATAIARSMEGLKTRLYFRVAQYIKDQCLTKKTPTAVASSHELARTVAMQLTTHLTQNAQLVHLQTDTEGVLAITCLSDAPNKSATSSTLKYRLEPYLKKVAWKLLERNCHPNRTSKSRSPNTAKSGTNKNGNSQALD